MQPIILASASPRRQELLRQLGIPFEAYSADISEQANQGEPPARLVLRLAQEKALFLQPRFPERILLGADTMVVLDQLCLGKPANKEQAVETLQRLAGRTHEVMTAVALVSGAGLLQSRINISRVQFRPLALAEIQAYVETGEPMDKAGCYGIQGMAACFIERLDGSYSGVMGLPLFETAALLTKAGYPIL